MPPLNQGELMSDTSAGWQLSWPTKLDGQTIVRGGALHTVQESGASRGKCVLPVVLA